MSTTNHLIALEISDPTYNENKKLGPVDQFFAKFIKDKRDLPFIYFCLKVQFIMIPFALCFFFLPKIFSIWVGVAYILFMLIFLFGPFTLMLHNTSHNALFKQKYKFMNNYIPWVLGLFFGQAPKAYYAHHIGMHHSENNMLKDLSCTITYKRDSFFGFMHYFLKFFFFGFFELYSYLKQRKLKKFLNGLIKGEISYYILCIALSFVNFQATLFVFIIPFVLIRFLMMAGNWGQHAFVDKNSPENNYRNSITCINSHYNKVSFNDGYHIGHHLRPGMHWTEMPIEFKENMANYAKENAIVFKKVDFFAVWLLLMTKSYGALANFYVDLDNRFEDKESIKAFLKSRTQWKIAA